MAYVLGFFAADGSMYRTRRGTHFIEFQITDEELLHKIQKLLGSNHKIALRRRKPWQKMLYRLQIGSKAMFCDLEGLGFTQDKSKTLLLPDIPNSFFLHFIRGYFDGDGHVWSGIMHKERPNPSRALFAGFTSGSEKLLLALKEVLYRYHLKGGSFSNRSRAFRLCYSTSDALKLYGLMYYDSRGLHLERKKLVFERFLRSKHNIMRA